jgi:hypothetical protein
MTRKVRTPAKYTTVRVKKLIQPATTRTIPIPAVYKTVTKKKKIAEGYTKWVPVVCKTNINSTMVRNVQSALKREGYYHGPIDGVNGPETKAAIRAYQRAKGLPVANMSVALMESLGLY